ncbi:unnamed protein product [Gordionus sp. m RMFG-2023]
MLIFLGVLTGIILFFSEVGHIEYTLSTSVFFLFLLPPIVLEAGYFMPRRPFFENIGTILLLAVVGTLWNTLSMGFALWGISRSGLFGIDVPLLHCLLFSSLISAVDPVAILAVFEEAQVNEILHIVVFGESLLNDGVAVVLYNMFGTYSKIKAENIISSDIVAGILSFFVVALGGTIIGSIFAFFTAWLTKYTEKVTVIEPLFIFLLAYVSYLVADMFKLSGILAIVFCGLIMRKYVEANISPKSTTTVKYTMKMLSSMCESIIFLFLGLSTVVDTHVWNTAFTLFSILFCLLFRAIGVLIMISLLNRRRLVKMNTVDIFILIYGGLRGAISFSLAMLLEEEAIGLSTKRMFVTTTVTIVIFTSFFQGLTIRPLVEFLRVKKASAKDKNMGDILLERCFDHLLVGIEDLIGNKGRNRVRDQFEVFETKYLKPFLMKQMPTSRENKLVQVCTKLNLKDANEYIHKFGGDIHAFKKDLSMLVDSQLVGEMPVVDTSHLDPVYSNREEADKWHYMMEDIMYQPRQRVKKYSRHMLFDNPSHINLQITPSYRHTSKLKTTRPLLESNKIHKRRQITEKSKDESIKYKEHSKLSGISGALRRFSLSITGSPSRDLGSINKKNDKRGSKDSEEGLRFFSDTPMHNVGDENGGNKVQSVNSPTTSSDISFDNVSTKAFTPVTSPTGSNKHVNFVLPANGVEKSTPKPASNKKVTNKFGSYMDDGVDQEEERLIKNDIDTDSSHETPPSVKTLQVLQPIKPAPLAPKMDMKDGLPSPILSQLAEIREETPKEAEDKLFDIKKDNEEVDDRPVQDEQRKESLTIAEKALPWKTPSPNPQKMPNPPRKMSDSYAHSPAHLTSLMDNDPSPPISNRQIHLAKGAKNLLNIAGEGSEDSFVSALSPRSLVGGSVISLGEEMKTSVKKKGIQDKSIIVEPAAQVNFKPAPKSNKGAPSPEGLQKDTL